MTYARRRLNMTFKLGQGSFGDGGFDTVKVTGLRASATISKAGGVSLSELNLRIYGLPLSVMNQLSTLGKPLIEGRNNTVIVEAGSDDAGDAIVFAGTIAEAWVEMEGAPDGVFIVSAYTGLLDALRPLPPSSFPGHADAATIMAGLAVQMGYAFENSGVSVQLANPYFAGAGRRQAETCARAGNFNFFIDDTTNTLAIWPRNGSRGGAIPLLSKDTGLKGYPAHTQNGIVVTTLFNPSITFGGQVEVRSILTPANGRWTVFSVVHDLEAETPDGQWFTRLQCTVLGYVALPR
jgi:hypothetical protein